ncbi:hypothetical protein [Paenibacillus castaneae]|uniref:hypothetical protein n=1 Tax=Paenibacillus castaneae TaxID=474957 RepID=UPI001ABAB5DD|nr:hypothetical protein [Paenibacillus castaneae]
MKRCLQVRKWSHVSERLQTPFQAVWLSSVVSFAMIIIATISSSTSEDGASQSTGWH